MITIHKSDGAAFAEILKTQRAKAYTQGPVYEQIREDFHGKCYLCEDDEPTQIQIEHHNPHQGDLVKQFDWNNLFYSCGHCNGIKGAHYWPLLNCTRPEQRVWESLRMEWQVFPKTSVTLSLREDCLDWEMGENTLRLLNKILNGANATPMQQDQAKSLRKKIQRANDQLSQAIERRDDEAILACLQDSAPFAGLLRWRFYLEFPAHWARLNLTERFSLQLG